MSTVIKVENLSKQYRLGLVGSGTMRDDLKRWWASIKGKEDPFLKIGETNDRSIKGESDYVWSLRDINFEVKQGEILGIIGKNGAGKSTLLKILSKVTAPTKGQIKVKGRIASLLEVGTGFHPELTGKENIYLNGAILGMRRSEITRKLDQIIDFAGVERYVDTPVKRYSSGMYVRLAFAVAAHLEPEILVVDEVLAVGDTEFQSKCLGKMKDVSEQGRTVLIVSHNMASIKNLCQRGLMLQNGTVHKEGGIDTVISEYLNKNLSGNELPVLNKEQIRNIQEGVINKGNPTLEIQKIELLDQSRKLSNKFYSNELIIIAMEIKSFDRISDLRVIFELVDEYNTSLLISQASDNEQYIKFQQTERINSGLYRFECIIPPNLLSEKQYFITAQIINVKNEHYYLHKAVAFDVQYTGYNGIFDGGGQQSFFRPNFKWIFNKIN